VAQKAFVRGYAWPDALGVKLVEVQDAVRHVVVADGGATDELYWAGLAYPDYCSVGCNCCPDIETAYSEIDYCDTGCLVTIPMQQDPSGLKGRHLDGTNIGFMDGHAAWYASKALRAMAPKALQPGGDGECPHAVATTEPELTGVASFGPETCVDGTGPLDWGFDCPGWP